MLVFAIFHDLTTKKLTTRQYNKYIIIYDNTFVIYTQY